MDLIKAADELKMLSDQQLAQVAQHPAVPIPPYLVMGELAKRQEMRKLAAADQAQQRQKGETTVAEDLVRRAAAPPTPPQPMAHPMPQQGLPVGPPATPQGAPIPVGMASGGLVACARRAMEGGGGTDMATVQFPWATDGGQEMVSAQFPQMAQQAAPGGIGSIPMPALSVEDYKQYAVSDPLENAKKAKAIYDVVSGGKDPLSGIAAEMQAMQANQKGVVDKPSSRMALIRMGLAMAASKNPSFMGAMAEGGIQGLDAYTKDRERFQADQIRLQDQARQMLQARAGLAERQSAQNQGLAGLAGQLGQQDNSRMDTIMNSREATLRQMAAAKEHSDLARQQHEWQLPLQTAEIEHYNAQTKKSQQQMDQESALDAKYLQMAGGDPARARTLRIAAEAQAGHITNPMDAYRLGLMRRAEAGDEDAARMLGIDSKQAAKVAQFERAVTDRLKAEAANNMALKMDTTGEATQKALSRIRTQVAREMGIDLGPDASGSVGMGNVKPIGRYDPSTGKVIRY